MQRSTTTPDEFLASLPDDARSDVRRLDAEEGGASLAESYRDRLGKVKVGRSSISFSRLADIDLAALLDLVGRARVLTSAPS